MKHARTLAPAYLSDAEVAALMGRSVAWLRKHRARLYREGFPRVDALVGRTIAADVDAWIARRRVVADATLPPIEDRESLDGL